MLHLYKRQIKSIVISCSTCNRGVLAHHRIYQYVGRPLIYQSGTVMMIMYMQRNSDLLTAEVSMPCTVDQSPRLDNNGPYPTRHLDSRRDEVRFRRNLFRLSYTNQGRRRHTSSCTLGLYYCNSIIYKTLVLVRSFSSI